MKAYNCPQDALQFVNDFNILVFHAMCSDEIDKFAEVSLGLEDHPTFGRFDKLAVEMQGNGAIEGSAAGSACCLVRCSPTHDGSLATRSFGPMHMHFASITSSWIA